MSSLFVYVSKTSNFSPTENHFLDNLPVKTIKRSLENPVLTNDSYDVERGLKGLISDVCLAEDDAGIADQVTWNGEALPSIPQSFLPIRMELFIWILLADTETQDYSPFLFGSSGIRTYVWISVFTTDKPWKCLCEHS